MTGVARAGLPVRERFVARGGARLYARDVGTGRPLVVVHGGPDFNHRYLLPELDRLASECRVVCYDQRGRGRSFAAGTGVADEDVTMGGEVEDLDGVRQSLGLGTVAVLGHSWGALVAMEYALAFPQHVSHLVVMSAAPASGADAAAWRQAACAGRSPQDAAAMATLVADPAYSAGAVDVDTGYYRIHFASALRRPDHLDELLARLRADFTPEGIVAARRIERRLYDETWSSDRYDLLTRLGDVGVPTLLLHGDADLIPVELARHIADAIPGARLDVVRDCGHFPLLEQPDAAVAAITAFVVDGVTGRR